MEYSIVDIQQFCARFYANSQILVTPYCYHVSFPPIPLGNVPINLSLVMLSNGDFVCLGLSHCLPVLALLNLKPAPTLRLQIKDTGSNESYFNDFEQIENVSSNGVGFRSFDYPRFIAGQTNLQFSLRNYNETTAYPGLELTMHGVMVRVFG